MSAYKFDGKGYAKKREVFLAGEVTKLKKRGIAPRLATLIIGRDPASHLYVRLKKEAAERVGIELDVYQIPQHKHISYVKKLLWVLSQDPTVHGIMIQLPMPERFTVYREDLFSRIPPEKDVDGHLKESEFAPAVVGAVAKVLDEATKKLSLDDPLVFVLGSEGTVGRGVTKYLTDNGFRVMLHDKKASTMWRASLSVPSSETLSSDVIITATGEKGVLKARSVKAGAAIIDVGAPDGDVDFEDVSVKAGFITPVPGGVGPVTITTLLENVVVAAKNYITRKRKEDRDVVDILKGK